MFADPTLSRSVAAAWVAGVHAHMFDKTMEPQVLDEAWWARLLFMEGSGPCC